MAEHFDVIIVGSGFGGSVMAYRLAEKGKRVCVLERGKAYPPGSFPRTPDKMSRNFWGPRFGLHGMYDVWSFRNLGALISSGLGGGSLIYANVLIRKDEKWFIKEQLPTGGYEEWPVSRADLDPCYERAEKMLDAHQYPFDVEPYKHTPKTHALKHAAEFLKSSGDYQPGEITWELPKLAVSFKSSGDSNPVPGVPLAEPASLNLHGMPRSTCRLCGECDVGCNYGSKNTLDYTYLSAARRQPEPVTILTRREVKEFKPRTGGKKGYEVTFINHEFEQTDVDKIPRETMTCDRLILSAGAIGTPYLLLKNRRHFPEISAMLGQRFGGNGDILGMARRCTQTVGGRQLPRLIEPSYGPVITSAIRVADAADGNEGHGRGFYIEDAGFPAFVQWMMVEANAPSNFSRALTFAKDWLGARVGLNPHSNLSAEFSALIGDGVDPATLMPMLAMGRDLPSGTMTLTRDNDLDIDWNLDDSREYFERVRSVMKDLTKAVGGSYLDDPIWFLSRSLTVHPLGGCPMGTSKETGVVDRYGQVFGYPDLYVSDGSVMPGPIGPNPSLTIAAFAEWSAEHMP